MKPRSAPPLSIACRRHVLTLESFDRQPVVLAFLERWDARVSLDAIRAELRGLGAVLVVLSPDGLFCFRADDEMEIVAGPGELDLSEIERVQRDWGIRACASSALFLVDGDRTIRFEHAFSNVTMEGLLAALHEAGLAMIRRTPLSVSRRELVMTSMLAGFALAFLEGCDPKNAPAPAPTTNAGSVPPVPELEVTLHVNGAPQKVKIDPRSTLLDTLRERMQLTGSKKGCDHGQCGACTVLMDGRRVNSCLIFAVMAEGAKIETIEGLETNGQLHPMQNAFIAEDGLQCGYCTPGQIMSAIGLVKEKRATSDADIREHMSGNICRCGAYTNIVSAIKRAQKEMA